MLSSPRVLHTMLSSARAPQTIGAPFVVAAAPHSTFVFHALAPGSGTPPAIKALPHSRCWLHGIHSSSMVSPAGPGEECDFPKERAMRNAPLALSSPAPSVSTPAPRSCAVY